MKSLSLSSPHIIAMVGIPGAGKTHFAAQFAETFVAPFICHHGLQPLSNNDDAVHGATLDILKEVMKTKQTIVYEGETDRRVERMELARLARSQGYKVLFVWVQTDQATSQNRSKKSIPTELYQARLRTFSPPHESEPHIVISGKHTYSTQARTLLKRLTEQARPASNHKITSLSTPAVPPRQASSRIKIS